MATGIDDIDGTAANDTFRAVTAASLDSADIIDGGAGNDVLNISAGGLVSGAAPVIKNVERINNSDVGKVLNVSDSTGIQQLWSNGTNGTYSYVGVAASTIIGAAGVTGGVKTVQADYAGDLSGDADAATYAIQDAQAMFISPDDSDIENITLLALGDTGATAVADFANFNSFDNAETVTVTGAGDVSIAADGSDLDTFDASAATGDVTLTLANSDEDSTISFGAGDDSFNAGAATGDLTINGGAGADTLTGGNGDDTIDGGEGNDVLVGGAGDDMVSGGAGNDILAGGAGEDSLTGGEGNDEFHFDVAATDDTITDFSAGDLISIDKSSLATVNSFDDSFESGIAGQSDLSSEDFQKIATFANLDAGMDGEIVVFNDSFADQAAVNAAANGAGATAEIFFVVFNEDAGNAQLYYDAVTGDATDPTLVADIEGMDLAGVQALTASAFDVY